VIGHVITVSTDQETVVSAIITIPLVQLVSISQGIHVIHVVALLGMRTIQRLEHVIGFVIVGTTNQEIVVSQTTTITRHMVSVVQI
jgi:hypothetical protein